MPETDAAVSIVSLQVAAKPEMVATARPKLSGIRKRPVRNIDVDEFGAMGDNVVDTEHHGGLDQAVYLYSVEDYAWWSEQLGRELAAGAFGENITVDSFGAGWDELAVGDTFVFGDVRLQATSARIPCDTFSAHMGEPDWIRRFRDARRPGVYCRVLMPGGLEVGYAGTRVAHHGDTITVLDTQDTFYDGLGERDDDFLARALAAPLHEKERPRFVAEHARRTVRG